MSRKRFWVLGFVLSAMLVLGLGYVYGQTPGNIPMFDPLGTVGVCNSVAGIDCVDSNIFQAANGFIGIGTAAPNFQLDVSSGGDAQIAVTSTGPGGRAWTLWSRGLAGVFQIIDMTVGASRLLIDTTGNVGIGLTSPAAKLHVNGTVRIDNGGFSQSSTGNFDVDAPFFPGGRLRILENGNVGIGTDGPGFKLDVSGAAHASSFPTSSDMRFKKNVQPLGNVLEKLEKIRGVAFDWNERYEALGRSTGRREIGLIAQEVETVFPELVTTWGKENYRAVDYGRLTAVLVEAIKGLRRENEALRQKTLEIDELRAQVSNLQGLLQIVLAQRPQKSASDNGLTSGR